MGLSRAAWNRKLRKSGLLSDGERVEEVDAVVAHTADGDFPANLMLTADAFYAVLELRKVGHVGGVGIPAKLPFGEIEWAVLVPGRHPELGIRHVGSPPGDFLRVTFQWGANKAFLERLEASVPGRWHVQ